MAYKPIAERFASAVSQADRLRSLAREQTEHALNVIQGILDGPHTSDRDRLTAAFGLLDRGWGKPPQQVLVGDIARETVTRKLTYEIVHVKEPQETDQDDLVVDFEEIKTNGHERH